MVDVVLGRAAEPFLRPQPAGPQRGHEGAHRARPARQTLSIRVLEAVAGANDRIEISLGGASWEASTITARGLVYYKSRGGAPSADELVAYIDFGEDVVSQNGTFAVTASTLRIQN